MDEQLREQVGRWVQEEADRYHDGVWLDAATAILAAAMEAEMRPDDPWAQVMARQRGRQAGRSS